MATESDLLLERKSWLDRALNLIAEVHAGEALTALALSLNVFLLLGSYYIIKPSGKHWSLPEEAQKSKVTPAPFRRSCFFLSCLLTAHLQAR
jgi:hypothetical protein